MIRLSNLLKEAKTGNDFIDFLLNEIQPIVNQIIEKYEKNAEKEGKPFTNYDRHFTELGLKYDLLKSLGSYTKPTDKLMYQKVSNSKKGTLVIEAIIDRDGVRYSLNTEVIYAGGYNIQRLHFRYITKTNLPRLNSNPYADKVKAQIQKLSKGEKLKKEIEQYKSRIITLNNNIEKLESQSDEETLRLDDYWSSNYSKLDWDEIVRRGVAKNFDYNPKNFEKHKEEWRQEIINRKYQKIKFYKRDIDSFEKTIKKLELKLNTLI